MAELASFDEFMGFCGLAHYQPLQRDIPPDDDFLVKDGGWWGCQYFLLRDDSPPDRAQPRSLADVFSAVDAALKRGARPAEIGRARFTDGGPAALPIGANPDFGADPRFLLYAEALAEVEAWWYLRGDDENAHWLEGRRNNIRVAIVSPLGLAAPTPPS